MSNKIKNIIDLILFDLETERLEENTEYGVPLYLELESPERHSAKREDETEQSVIIIDLV